MHHELTFAGHGIRLLPLAPQHAEHLFGHIDDSLWSGMAARRPDSVEDLAELFAARLADPSALPFTVADGATGALAGTTGLYDVDARLGRAELGGTFFGRPHWGSGMNPASKLLLLQHGFEDLTLSRIAFRVDTRNARSAKALLALGAVYEGTLRAYRPGHDGPRVDAAVFSVLDAEWPMVRARLLARLAARAFPISVAPADAA
ncbi:GNAT family N-acetyltransferase [Sinomonas notoginsengisoli]|uniref:GNAT family N-acetyltransferase n=1 Tax=Sinomonas notoginsengisoli TaxID=1457311 RepID=UPI001F3E9CE0|nr:GNAT family protein [Sinomonas notoginsengisoli]